MSAYFEAYSVMSRHYRLHPIRIAEKGLDSRNKVHTTRRAYCTSARSDPTHATGGSGLADARVKHS